MELAMVIWLIGALSSLSTLFGWFVALSLGTVAASMIVYLISYDTSAMVGQTALDWRKRSNTVMKFSLSIFVLVSFLFTLIPSTKTGWLMAGGYVAQTAIQSDSAKKFAKIVELKLEEVLDEATEQAKIKAKSINTDKK